MSELVQIEYHPPCTFYGDEGCIEQTGEYVCACGASTAWHKTTPAGGIVGYAVSSVPLASGRGYLITIESKKPLNTLTMHNEVMLVGIGDDDEVVLTPDERATLDRTLDRMEGIGGDE